MVRKFVTYTLGLVGLYLVVEHASGSGSIIKAGADGGSQFVKTLQGR